MSVDIDIQAYYCLICGNTIPKTESGDHKKNHHADVAHYGILWPKTWKCFQGSKTLVRKIPTYCSDVIAQHLGVRKVYIRNEGHHLSGSMKDYIVERGVRKGYELGYRCFSVVSSGNHAVSLAMYTMRYHPKTKVIVFVPANSSKIPFLSSFPHVTLVAMHDAIFEDVYNLVAKMHIDGVYDVNAHNEELLPALVPVASDIFSLSDRPTHILAGVGNGTYLAGIGWGLFMYKHTTSKIIPVGMDGAFPCEDAWRQNLSIKKYHDFGVPEEQISAAEGSIALESYNMPQLLHAIRYTDGFPLGALRNEHLQRAYELLAEDQNLLSYGAIPEPTGILPLAAALQWKHCFPRNAVLHLSFTGHGVKDTKTIGELLPNDLGRELISSTRRSRSDLIALPNVKGRYIGIKTTTTAAELNDFLRDAPKKEMGA